MGRDRFRGQNFLQGGACKPLPRVGQVGSVLPLPIHARLLFEGPVVSPRKRPESLVQRLARLMAVSLGAAYRPAHLSHCPVSPRLNGVGGSNEFASNQRAVVEAAERFDCRFHAPRCPRPMPGSGGQSPWASFHRHDRANKAEPDSGLHGNLIAILAPGVRYLRPAWRLTKALHQLRHLLAKRARRRATDDTSGGGFYLLQSVA